MQSVRATARMGYTVAPCLSCHSDLFQRRGRDPRMTPEAGLNQPRSKIASSALGRRCECRLMQAGLAGKNEPRIWSQYRACSQSSSLTSNRRKLGYGPFSRPARTCLPGCGRLSALCEIGCLPPRMQRQMWRAEQSRQEMRGRFLVTVIATKPPQGDLYA